MTSVISGVEVSVARSPQPAAWSRTCRTVQSVVSQPDTAVSTARSPSPHISATPRRRTIPGILGRLHRAGNEGPPSTFPYAQEPMTRTGPFVGRAPELAAVEQAVLRPAPGARVVALAGEPGMGKSRLLAEVAASATAVGRAVRQAGALELPRQVPFALVLDALSAEPGGEALPEGLDRYPAQQAMRARVVELAATEPIALLLDDVHWADAPSLELLAGLVARPPAAPLTLVLAFQPAALSGPLAEALRDAERADTVTRVALPPLDLDDTGELLGGRFGHELTAALHRESGGNPFYLEALADAAAERARVPISHAGERRLPDVPAPVVAALEAELARLDPAARDAACAAAVVGDPVSRELVAEVAGQDETTAVRAVDELVGRD